MEEAASSELGLRKYSSEGETPDFDDSQLAELRRRVQEFREGTLANSYARLPPRQRRFTTWSGIELPDVATPADVPLDYLRDLGLPGEYPFTRGVQPSMYRGRLWTMRMFAGFG